MAQRRRTLAHLSDLHLGHKDEHVKTVARLIRTVEDAGIDHVVVTGDITHRGDLRDLETFHALFSDLERQGRLTVVPGNHDRVGPAGETLMPDGKVQAVHAPGLFLVRVDSTAPHNRSFFRCHGELSDEILEEIEEALGFAPPGALRVVLLHHHPVPLPEETVGEWFATFLGWPHALELPRGPELLERLKRKADLVLHGHRHVPHERAVDNLQIFNAGSSTELQAFRVFTHADGHLHGAPRWHRATRRPSQRNVRASEQTGAMPVR